MIEVILGLVGCVCRPTLAVAIVVVMLLVIPTAASAATTGSAVFFDGSRPPAEFSLRGSNGYSIRVDGAGRRVNLSVAGGGGFAEYRVRGRASTERIRARFGNLGRVAVEFRPSGSVWRRVPPSRCKGKARVTRFGVFVGKIRFVGEQGYTRVRAVRARGRSRTSPRWKCKRRRGGGKLRKTLDKTSAQSELTVLEAIARQRRLSFGALSFRSSGEEGVTLFLVASAERRGRMQVSRSAFAFAREQAFTFDEALTSATVSPPKPFEGTGFFRRSPNGRARWTGSLTVSLPGAEDIALTGSRYKARLIQPETLAQVPERLRRSDLAMLRPRGGTAG